LKKQFPTRKSTRKQIKVVQELNPSSYETPIANTKRKSKNDPKVKGILKRDSNNYDSSKPKISKIEGDISPTINNVPKYIQRRMHKNGKRIMNIKEDKLHDRIAKETKQNPKKMPLENSSQEYENNSNKYVTPMHGHPNEITLENLLISDSVPLNINTAENIPNYDKKVGNFFQI
jgi:hypothetical protein